MSKIKSMVFLILITIVLVVVGVMSFASFPVPGTVKDYNSILSIIDLGADLGGGYYTVYYPDGVISAEEFESEYAALPDEDKADYADRYVAHGGIYVEKDLVDDTFIDEFQTTLEIIVDRFEALNLTGLTVGVQDDYSIRVQLPNTVEDPDAMFEYLAYTGEFNLTHSSSTRPLLEATRYHSIDEYFVKAGTQKAVDDTPYISLELTKLGREEFKEISGTVAGDTEDQVLYFNVGEQSVISLTVDGVMDTKTVYISGYDSMETANVVAVLINSCFKNQILDMELRNDGTFTFDSTLGDSVTTLMLIGLGVAILVMAIYSVVKYRGLGAVHLYAFVTFAFAYMICLAAIPGMAITLGSLLGVLFAATLMVACNFVIFGNVKAEFETGKTMAASVKSGYKKSLFSVAEIHGLVLVGALLTYFIAITEVQIFGLVLAVGAALSAAITLAVTRFYWHIMMNQAKNKFKFCNWKREVEDE